MERRIELGACASSDVWRISSCGELLKDEATFLPWVKLRRIAPGDIKTCREANDHLGSRVSTLLDCGDPDDCFLPHGIVLVASAWRWRHRGWFDESNDRDHTSNHQVGAGKACLPIPSNERTDRVARLVCQRDHRRLDPAVRDRLHRQGCTV